MVGKYYGVVRLTRPRFAAGVPGAHGHQGVRRILQRERVDLGHGDLARFQQAGQRLQAEQI